MGERIGRAKVRQLVGRDKDSLISKAKAVHASKAKSGIHSLLPIGRQVFSHLQESRALSRVMPSLSMCPPLLPSSPAFISEMMSYDTGHPFGQLESAVPAVSPPNTLCTLTYSLVGQCEEQKRP